MHYSVLFNDLVFLFSQPKNFSTKNANRSISRRLIVTSDLPQYANSEIMTNFAFNLNFSQRQLLLASAVRCCQRLALRFPYLCPSLCLCFSIVAQQRLCPRLLSRPLSLALLRAPKQKLRVLLKPLLWETRALATARGPCASCLCLFVVVEPGLAVVALWAMRLRPLR